MKLIFALLGIALTVSSCGSGSSAVDVSTSGQNFVVIPAQAASCLSRKTSSPPTLDVSSAFFKIPVVTINRNHPTKTTAISAILISVIAPDPTNPLSTKEIDCNFGADSLVALSSAWTTYGDSIIKPTDPAIFTTDCPIYCGGFSVSSVYSAQAKLTVFGYEYNLQTDQPDPFVNTSYFTVSNVLSPQ